MESAELREARFERIYAECAPAVLAYALRRSSPDDAADVVAETFVIAWRRLSELADADVLPWLYGVARRVLSTQRRSSNRQAAVAVRLALERVEPTTPDDDASTRVVGALAKLTESDREVLMLTAWEGLSGRQAASVLSCSPTAYRIRLHRARRRLELRLSELDRSERKASVIRPEPEEKLSC
jgi:RNA polymerase sigma-70 factor (ECF subfamily)